MLLAILGATATWSWSACQGKSLGVSDWSRCWGSAASSSAMITMFKPTSAPMTAPLYAALEGVLLGAISQIVELTYGGRVPGRGGIVMQAVRLTCGVLFVMMFVYATRIIRVTEKLQMAIVAATGRLALFYIVAMLLSFFGFGTMGLFTSVTDRDRLQPVRGRPGGVQPAARLRLHREIRRVTRPPSTWSGTAPSA